jgi:hypothetical protein
MMQMPNAWGTGPASANDQAGRSWREDRDTRRGKQRRRIRIE